MAIVLGDRAGFGGQIADDDFAQGAARLNPGQVEDILHQGEQLFHTRLNSGQRRDYVRIVQV